MCDRTPRPESQDVMFDAFDTLESSVMLGLGQTKDEVTDCHPYKAEHELRFPSNPTYFSVPEDHHKARVSDKRNSIRPL